jgi:hypothetical protein
MFSRHSLMSLSSYSRATTACGVSARVSRSPSAGMDSISSCVGAARRHRPPAHHRRLPGYRIRSTDGQDYLEGHRRRRSSRLSRTDCCRCRTTLVQRSFIMIFFEHDIASTGQALANCHRTIRITGSTSPRSPQIDRHRASAVDTLAHTALIVTTPSVALCCPVAGLSSR